jgi:hypothetical protein
MTDNNKRPLTVGKARSILTWIWLPSVLVLIIIIIAQIAGNQIYAKWEIPCGWLTSLAFPNLTMIIAVSNPGYSPAHEKIIHSEHLFHMAVVFSIFYILSLYLLPFYLKIVYL